MESEQKKPESQLETLKLLYEVNNDQFKYFLTWRQLMLAGYFTIMAALGLALKWSWEKNSVALFVLPFVGAWISVLFWALDRRNRQLYKLTSEAGALLEESMGLKGIGQYGKFASAPKTRLGHGAILAIFYLGSAAAILLLAAILL